MIAQLDRQYIRTSVWKTWSRLVSYAMFEGRPLTTKGRWINPLVFFLFAIFKRLPTLRPVKSPVFIVGTGRSGTTVLGLVLSMHRQVSYLNEPKALWYAAEPRDDLIGSYSRGEAHYRLGAADVRAKTERVLRRLYGACLFFTGGRRMVDKYPEMIFRADFLHAMFPDAKLLFLMRNGMDTCSSIESWSDRKGQQVEAEKHDWWGANDRKWKLLVEQVVAGDAELGALADTIAGFDSDLDRAAVEWMVTMREGMRLQREFPDAVLPVRYETLAAEPEVVLSGILDFCGLPADERFMQYATAKLAPVPPYRTVELHPEIRTAFAHTMKELGYVD